MIVADLVRRVPISTGMAIGTTAGVAVAAGRETYFAQHPHGAHRDDAVVAQIVGGLALSGAGLLTAMHWEQRPGPYVDRFHVDGLERVAQRHLNLDWSGLTGRGGAIVAMFGVATLLEGVVVGMPVADAAHHGHAR